MSSNQSTPNDFIMRLRQRVSHYNARLVLHSTMVSSGLKMADDVVLSDEQFECLCLGLIKAGGPAFQVGQAMYRELKGQATKH
ncbi:MAG: hypothetical protein SGJ18_14910 [Pseudomonadota bacterium]|nr:hypothetical protein [Pseudomonadota bacterium]